MLTIDHFTAAEKHANAFAMVRWAFEAEATVREMEAWGRADRGEPPLVEKRKPKAALFE